LKARPPGRPTLFSPTLAKAVCEKIAGGWTLTAIARDPNMPSRDDFFRWLREHAEFHDMYFEARRARADARSDAMDGIVERVLKGELDPRAAQVALTHERWAAGREAPKRYGERLEIDADVRVEPVSFVIVRSAPKGGTT
jgi:hypothetical protein